MNGRVHQKQKSTFPAQLATTGKNTLILTPAPARYGVPEHLRSDNRPEFIAACMQDWLEAQEIKTLYIKPASPWENGYIETFTTSCAMNA